MLLLILAGEYVRGDKSTDDSNLLFDRVDDATLGEAFILERIHFEILKGTARDHKQQIEALSQSKEAQKLIQLKAAHELTQVQITASNGRLLLNLVLGTIPEQSRREELARMLSKQCGEVWG